MLRRIVPAGMFAFLAIAVSLCAQESKGGKKLTDDELREYLEKKDAKIFFLDVREPKEIEDLGSVAGYVNIPLGQLESRLSELPKDKLIVTL
jgi:rhodanese-related sulfurtransferase